jgi:hypothetical protein
VARRLVPAHLFWAVAFLATRALATHQLPSPRTVVEGIVLGKAAAHLYFTPQLIALTASAPLWLRFARTPVRALAAGVGLGAVDLALATSWLPRLDGVGAAWGGALVGFLGLAPFALGGLALGRAWRGIAPAGDAAEKVRLYAGVVAAASAVLLVWAALEAGGDVLPPGLPIWAANNGCAVAVPLLLLAWRGRIPPAVLRLAPLTLGVYLVHPFFVQALRAGEGRVPGLAGHEALLILPNAAVAILGSFAVVRLLARTPLRRCVL